MKIKFTAIYKLPLKKTLEHRNMVIVGGSIFHEGNKCYQQMFLDECLYKL